MKVRFQINDTLVKNKNIGKKVSEVSSSNSSSHFGMKSTKFPRGEAYRITLGVKSTEFPRGKTCRHFAESEIYKIASGWNQQNFSRSDIYRISSGWNLQNFARSPTSSGFPRGEFYIKIPRGEIYRSSSWWNLQNFFALPSPLPGDSGGFVGIFLLKHWLIN